MHSNEVLCNTFDEANKAEVNKAENTGIFFDGLEEEVVLLQGTSPNIQIRSILDSASMRPSETTTTTLPQNTTSPIWRYFSLKNSGLTRRSICSLCCKEAPFSGTSNLWKHLAAKHYAHCLKLKKQEQEQQQMKQKAISNFFPTADISKQAIITNMILSQLICRDLQPFSIVEDPGFNEFIRYLCPTYRMPSRKHISTSVLDDHYYLVSSFYLLI